MEFVARLDMSICREYLLFVEPRPRLPELKGRGDPVEEGVYWESNPPKESYSQMSEDIFSQSVG